MNTIIESKHRSPKSVNVFRNKYWLLTLTDETIYIIFSWIIITETKKKKKKNK